MYQEYITRNCHATLVLEVGPTYRRAQDHTLKNATSPERKTDLGVSELKAFGP